MFRRVPRKAFRRRLPSASVAPLILAAACFVGFAMGGGRGHAQDLSRPVVERGVKWIVEAGRRPVRTRSLEYPGMGAIPSDPLDFDRTPSFRVAPAPPGDRPARVLLTEYLPPVRNQGPQGSCVGWSSAYYNYTYAIAKNRRLSEEERAKETLIFSPAFVYNQNNKGADNGMQIADAFQFLKEHGCAALSDMPYDAKNYKGQPEPPAVRKASRYKALDIAHLFVGKPFGKSAPDLDALKTFLAETKQPFVMAIPIFDDFPKKGVPPDYVYHLTLENPKRSDLIGLHAITVVGYDDTLKAFRMVNSWGPNWGDQGFLWLDEAFVRDYAVEGWSCVAGGPRTRDPRAQLNTWTSRVTIAPPPSRLR